MAVCGKENTPRLFVDCLQIEKGRRLVLQDG